MKPSATFACLIIGAAALNGCTQPANCAGGNYRNGCAAGPVNETPPVPASAAVSPAPAPVLPPAASTPPVTRPPASNYGDPASFADVDDMQCRSYGLKFGTHDYADCRIQLSAQHRGLAPNNGPSSGR